MERAKLLRLGGYAAGVVLIVFGIATIAIGIVGKSTVEDELSQEKIVGSPDMSPEGIAPGIEEAKLTVDAPDCDVAEEPITTGSEARCFGQYMRIHALESSGGLTYAEMGRYVSASDPTDPAGTNDEAAAAKDESGKPVSNAARNLWVTETALSTALNVSYFATGVATFSHRRRDRADPRWRRLPAPRSRRLPQSKPRSEAGVGAAVQTRRELRRSARRPGPPASAGAPRRDRDGPRGP